MYTFQANIGSLSSPQNGSGWVVVECDYSKATLKKVIVEKQIFARAELGGHMIFTDQEYEALKQLHDDGQFRVGFRVYHDDDLGTEKQMDGFLNLMGEWHDDQKEAKLEVTTDDQYTKIMDDYETEVNIKDDHDVIQVGITHPVHGTIHNPFVYRLDEIIKSLFRQFDDEIAFDGISFGHLAENADSRNYLISNIADQFIDDAGDFLSAITSRSNISLKQIFDWLRQFRKTYWYLERVSGTYYFRIYHRSDSLYTEGDLDMTDYKNEDLCAENNSFKWKTADLYYKLHRDVPAKNTDFVGADIIASHLQGIEKQKEITNSKFATDIQDIHDNQDNYPSESEDSFCMLTCDIIEQNNYQYQNGNIGTGINGFDTYQSSGTGDVAVIHNDSSFACFYYDHPFQGQAGDIVTIYFNTGSNFGGQMYCVLNTGLGNGENKSNVVLIKEGHNIITLKTIEDGTFYVCFAKLSGIAGGFWQFENMNIGERFQNRNGTGALSGDTNVQNVELSLANLDDGHNEYELPYETVSINGARHTASSAQQIRTKLVELDNVPMYRITEINEIESITTEQGDIYFDELEIDMYEGKAKLSGYYR